jgi:hypothetical protein
MRQENAALREALDTALLALRTIPQGRLDKYAGAVDDDNTLGYRTAVQEVDRLALAARAEILDRLAELGVSL